MNRSNTIYYRFKSEKKKYSINFDTTEISIGDIKKEIIKRRNMEKVPERFELIFYNENNEEIRDENVKINPLQMLCIKRIPFYKLSSNFVETIIDPSDIGSTRFGDMTFMPHKTLNNPIYNYDPIEKIIPKINFDVFKKKFSCNICFNTEEKFFVLSCCGESICEKCKNKIQPLQQNCKFCDDKTSLYMPNNSIGEFRDRIINIINKKNSENEMKKLSAANQINNVIKLDSANPNLTEEKNEKIKNEEAIYFQNNNNQNNPNLNNQNINNSYMNNYGNQSNMQMNINNNYGRQENLGINSNYNPHQVFFENARFFIIKSTNKENVDISQKNAEWATTQSNQKKLNEAFQNNYVVLIFSINKSGCFQGYTIMTSYISDKVSNCWLNESSVKLGGSFAVQWLCMCEFPFNKVRNLTNPINNNESVIKSRDTQELPRDIGTALCNLCFEQEKSEVAYKIGRQQIIDDPTISKLQEEIKKNKESKKYFFLFINFS